MSKLTEVKSVLSGKFVKELLSVARKDVVGMKLDIGNGYFKFIASSNGKTVMGILPSGFVYEADVLTDDSGIGGKSNNRYYVVSENNPYPVVFLWDEGINKSSSFEPLNGGEGRYKNTDFNTFLSMALHEVLERLGVKNKSDKEIYIVTGVPSDEKGTRMEEQLKQSLFNTPKINAKGEDFKPLVKDVKIVAQPVGTALNLLLDIKGKIINNYDFENKKIAVIDIGFGTTDGAVVVNGQSLSKERFSVDVGMNNVYEDVGEEVTKVLGNTIPSSNIEIQQREVESKGEEFTQLVVGRKIFPVEKALQESLRRNYSKIKNKLNRTWKKQSQFDEIILTGGGAEMFYPFFKEDGFEIKLAENNQFANVLGYYKLSTNINYEIYSEGK